MYDTTSYSPSNFFFFGGDNYYTITSPTAFIFTVNSTAARATALKLNVR